MSYHNAFWKAVFTGIVSKPCATIAVPQIEARLICKDNLVPISLSDLVLRAHCRHSRRCRRRLIDEAYISTPAAVAQRAANCLEKAVQSFPAMQRRCRLSHADASSFVIHCQFFELFGSRRSPAFKLASLWNCLAAHELLLRDRKILLLEGR
ncbi:uncharacterized protein TNCV_826091 [Trichonephila clavipes]|nr:uncharacterized protein TNCV_826091 [Trichonephila clavipes]